MPAGSSEQRLVWIQKENPVSSNICLKDFESGEWKRNWLEKKKHVPPVPQGGENREFLVFCQQYVPTIPEVIAQQELDWQHDKGTSYRVVITKLCNSIKEVFPKMMNFTVIESTGQCEGAAPDEFLTRLQAVSDQHVVIVRPGGYLDRARLDETTRHALHAYNFHLEAAKKKSIKREEDLLKATLATQEFQRANLVLFHGQGRGYRRGWGWGGQSRRQARHNGCFICKATNHWIKDCPHKTHTKPGQPDQSGGGGGKSNYNPQPMNYNPHNYYSQVPAGQR